MAQSNPIVLYHPRERLPMLAPKNLEIDSKINVMHGKFFITKKISRRELIKYVFIYGKYKHLLSLLLTIFIKSKIDI